MTSAGGGDPREWLGEVKSEYWEQVSEPEDPEGDPGALHVLFEVAGSRFAVDARCCKGVFRKPEITELPGLPAHVLGVVGVRGEMISATDPARYLGLAAARPERPGYLLILADGELSRSERDAIDDLIAEYSLRHDVVISAIVYPSKVFLEYSTPFLLSVKEDGIAI